MDGGLWHCTGGSDQDHPIPKTKKCKMAKWLSEEALQIAEKRREAKGKGEKEDTTIWMQSSKERPGEMDDPERCYGEGGGRGVHVWESL